MSKSKQASAISGGIFLIGLGILFITDWFWPGILLVIGLSSGAELIFRGKTREGISTLLTLSVIAIVFSILQNTDLSWAIIGPFILIVLGVITLFKAFFLKTEHKDEPSD